MDYELISQQDNDYRQIDRYFGLEIQLVLQKGACDCSFPWISLCCLAPASIPGTIHAADLLFDEYIVIDVAESVPPSFGGIGEATASLNEVDIDLDLGSVLNFLLGWVIDYLTEALWQNVDAQLAPAHVELTFEIWDQYIDPLLTE